MDCVCSGTSAKLRERECYKAVPYTKDTQVHVRETLEVKQYRYQVPV